MDGLLIVFGLGIFLVFFFFFLFLFLIVRVRGDVVRVWVSPVSYFRGIRYNRPIRIKVRHRGIAQTLNASLVNAIDNIVFKTVEKTEGKKEGNSSETLNFEASLENVPSDLFQMWKVIRQQAKNYTIYGTSFTRRWRTKQGVSGRWVYMYHLFSLDEMAKTLGRHKLIQGVFLENPLATHTPPTKEEWVLQRIREDRAKGVDVKTLERRIKSYEKEYRRISKEKWLNVIFHPTVTTSKETEVVDRLTGFENVMSVTAYAMNALGPKLARLEALSHFAEGREAYERQLTLELHETADRLGDEKQFVELEHRSLLEKATPTTISTTGVPLPPGFPSKPPEQPKPSRLRMPLPENFWTYVTIFAGFFLMVLGLALYVSNPSLWGVMFFGVTLFMFGVFMYWREGKKVKVPEVVKEKMTEEKEAITGE